MPLKLYLYKYNLTNCLRLLVLIAFQDEIQGKRARNLNAKLLNT
jgi:hypothetical protein